MFHVWAANINHAIENPEPIKRALVSTMYAKVRQHSDSVENLISLESEMNENIRDNKARCLLWHYMAGHYYHLLRQWKEDPILTTKEEKILINNILQGPQRKTIGRYIEFYEIVTKFPSLLLCDSFYSVIVALHKDLMGLGNMSRYFVTFSNLLPEIRFEGEDISPYTMVNHEAGFIKRNIYTLIYYLTHH